MKDLLKEKQFLYKQSKSDPSYKERYNQVSKQYDKPVSQWHDHIESAICDQQNPKSFYAFTNKNLKGHSFISSPKADSGDRVILDLDKANTLNSVFQNVFITDNGQDLHLNELCNITKMNDIKIIAKDITTALANMSNKTSRTPDEIPSYFFKRITPWITNALCHLYQLHLSTAKIPYQWKQALVIPIHKKGIHKLPSNYCPILLTCVMCRLLESIIVEKLFHYLLRNNISTSRQYGFIPGRPTST